MRALLLAGGLGTRLRPITDNVPKCLVPVNGKPLLAIWLERLGASGYGPYLVNTHYKVDQVEAFVASSPFCTDVTLTYEPELLGTAGTLIRNLDFFGDEDGLLIHADNYCLADFSAFIEAHQKRPAECLMSMMTFRTDAPSSCGIVTIDERGVVVAFDEKPENPKGNLANGAIYLLSAEFLAQLRNAVPGTADFSTQIIPDLVGRIFTYETSEQLIDIGTPDAYARANAHSEACISCQVTSVRELLEFGSQPPSNRFYSDASPQVDAHRLALGQCVCCGLIQLVDPMPVDMVRSRYPWIGYNEPENHLDSMVERLIETLDLRQSSRIVGLTYKDDSTLARFERSGFSNTYRYDARSDLGVENPAAGLETIQRAMTSTLATQLVQRHGLADVLIARHVLEHAHAPREFLDGLKQLVKPDGFLIFETPESTKFLGAFDYTFVWEEHISYFTRETLGRLLTWAALSPVELFAYPFQLEDSLIAIVRPLPGIASDFRPLSRDLELGAEFAAHFLDSRDRVRNELGMLKRAGKRVAVFGAGHLAAKFLNFFELADIVDCVIDDNPNKLGMHMPGSGLVVRPSSILVDEKIDLCLLSLSPESEKKVIAAKHAYVESGGVFRSIFALSPITYLGG